MGVLLLLLTIGGLFVAVLLFIAAAVAKMPWLAKFTAGGAAIWLTIYAVMLLGSSVTSSETALAVNQPKAFCGFYLDCHLHSTITGVRTASEIGGKTASGTFYIAAVKVWSDARNPEVAFRLLQPKVELKTADGAVLSRVEEAEKLLPSANVQLSQEIRGSQTIEKEIVFDVPARAADLKLLITEGYGIDRYLETLLIGDEDSFLHRRSYFKIPEQSVAAGVR